MGSRALVDDFEAGSGLLSALLDSGFPVELAAWVRETESDSWRLFIASPLVDEVGKHRGYERLVEILSSLDEHTLPVSRITLIGVTDEAIHNLNTWVWEGAPEMVHVGPGNIGKQSAADVYVYHPDAIQYESHVFSALQRVLNEVHGVIRRKDRLYGSENLGFDFIADRGEGPVAIEVKSTPNLNIHDVRRQIEQYRAGFPLLVITPAMIDQPIDQWGTWLKTPVRIVRWRGPEDDAALKATLGQLLHSQSA